MVSRTPEYLAWHDMIRRCTNPARPDYARYGGRGISVCGAWRWSFDNFLADMGPRPAGMSLDRINNDGNYEPGNCRWASASQQNANRRRSAFTHGRPVSGATQIKKTGRWQAQIGRGGKTIYLGTFNTRAEAEQRYVEASKEIM